MSEGFNHLHHTFECKLAMSSGSRCIPACGATARFNSRLPTTAGRGEVSFGIVEKIVQQTVKKPKKAVRTFHKAVRKARESDRIIDRKQRTGGGLTPEAEAAWDRLAQRGVKSMSPELLGYRRDQAAGNVGSGRRTLGGDREAREQLQRDIAAANGREPAEQSKSGPPSEEVARQRERAEPERGTSRVR